MQGGKETVLKQVIPYSLLSLNHRHIRVVYYRSFFRKSQHMIMTSLSLVAVLVALHVLRYEKMKLEDNFPGDCHKKFFCYFFFKKKHKPMLMLLSKFLL